MLRNIVDLQEQKKILILTNSFERLVVQDTVDTTEVLMYIVR